MRAYFGGQIQEQRSGDLVAVIFKSQDPSDEFYQSLICSLRSEEFVRLTGEGTITVPDRVYLGVSESAGEAVSVMAADIPINNRAVEEMDSYLLKPIFVGGNREKPLRIVLEETETGYEVVEGN